MTTTQSPLGTWERINLIHSLPATIDGIARSLLVAIAKHEERLHRVCYASYATISREIGFSVSSVRRAAETLEKLGVIHVKLTSHERKVSGRNRQVRVNWDALATMVRGTMVPQTMVRESIHHAPTEQTTMLPQTTKGLGIRDFKKGTPGRMKPRPDYSTRKSKQRHAVDRAASEIVVGKAPDPHLLGVVPKSEAIARGRRS